MDYKKTAILLKKIKSLHNTLMDNSDQPSTMEQQLMKSYLRDFFDSFVSGEGGTDIFAEENQDPKAQLQTPPIQQQTQSVQQESNLSTKLDSVTPKPIVAIENTEPNTIQHTQNPAPVEEPAAPVQEKQAEAKTDIEMVVSGKDVIKQIVTDPVDEDLIALFIDAPVTDLSDKLSLLPVNDLTKALSINERFFTIQELFGGNSDLFQTTLKKLNGLSSFEEASDALIKSVASEFDWASASKQKKAANFIKLVRRRYQ